MRAGWLCRWAVSLVLVSVVGGGVAQAKRVACQEGFAESYPCRQVDLLAHLPLPAMGGGSGNDIWGWTDPLTGQEIAIMGRSSGTSFIDVSSPENPIYLGNLPTQSVASTWRDVKVFEDYALIVSEAAQHGLQIFDLKKLRDVTATPTVFRADRVYNRIGSAHNVVVNEVTGYAYVVGAAGPNGCAGGLHMIDIRQPLQPQFAGCFSADGYTHDAQCIVYRGPDVEHQGEEICLAANEDTLTLVDVTVKSAPLMLSRTGYSGRGYTHQGWFTEDHRFILLDDETDEANFGHGTRTYVWDVRDLDSPVLVGAHEASTDAIDHNQYIKGRHTYQANYTAGLQILRLVGLATANLLEVGFFDIHPEDNGPAAGQPEALHPDHEGGDAVFQGAWSVYPYFASGVVVVSGIEGGLFVLRPRFGGGGGTVEQELGGEIEGVVGDRAICRDQTTGGSVSIELSGAGSWDCQDAGLNAGSGDRLVQTVTGSAAGAAVSGHVHGVENLRLTCRNLTRGRSGSVAVEGNLAWDCAATGVGFAAGDRVSVSIGGDVGSATESAAAVRSRAAEDGDQPPSSVVIGSPDADSEPGGLPARNNDPDRSLPNRHGFRPRLILR